jgi:hypothetical protein
VSREMSVNFYKTMWYCISDDSNLHGDHHESLTYLYVKL